VARAPALLAKINRNLTDIDASVKHIADIAQFSKVNLDRQTQYLSQRHAIVSAPEEPGTFPLSMLPRELNLRFFGRREELEKINKHLGCAADSNTSLRTYTLYNRRGVGKTEIALQYAYSNPSKFDAIFWIQCQTSVSLRQSFTSMAVKLNLPGANQHGQSWTFEFTINAYQFRSS
jgi:hypothetical protein